MELNIKEMSFGDYLKTKRFFSKMTLRDVEKASDGNISNAYLSQLETGKAKAPSAKVLFYLSKIYNADIKEMVEKSIDE